MKKLFLICLFFAVSSIYAQSHKYEYKYHYDGLRAFIDQQGTIFNAINYNDYNLLTSSVAEANEWKSVCPYGYIKIIRGYITSSGEEIRLENYKILGCDTEQEFNKRLGIIYKIYPNEPEGPISVY